MNKVTNVELIGEVVVITTEGYLNVQNIRVNILMGYKQRIH